MLPSSARSRPRCLTLYRRLVAGRSKKQVIGPRERLTTPDRTIKNNGPAHQIPIVLCQFQSRAFPRNPPRNQTAGRKYCCVQARGHQR